MGHTLANGQRYLLFTFLEFTKFQLILLYMALSAGNFLTGVVSALLNLTQGGSEKVIGWSIV